MKNHLEKIRQKVSGAPRYSVSPELDRKVQGALGWQKTSPTFELESEESLLSLNWVGPWIAKSLRQFALAVVAVALIFVGFWSFNQNSYTYHLGKAKAALADLQTVLGGKSVAQSLWMGQAFAEDSVPSATINEAQVVDLSQTVVGETEKAIEIASKKTDPLSVQQALDEVVAVQDQSVPVLAEAAEAVTTAEATQKIAEALKDTTTDQILVIKAKVFVATASSKGEKQVAIEIQTSREAKPAIDESKPETKTDEARLAEAKAEYQVAKAQVENVKVSGADAEEVDKLETKLDHVVEAFKDGKVGRAHGLSTALEAQGKHLISRAGERGKSKSDKLKKDKEDSENSKEEESKLQAPSVETGDGVGKVGESEQSEVPKVGSPEEDSGDRQGAVIDSRQQDHPRIPRTEKSDEGDEEIRD